MILEAANTALPRFIAEYNARFAIPAGNTGSAFVPAAVNGGLEKLLSARYERVTDACGCCSFQNFLFRITGGGPLWKKITFLFNQKNGFPVRYDKKYYPASVPGFSNKRGDIHVHEVTKALLYRHYLADGKTARAAGG
jgi:hypothetical protein